MYSFRNDYAEGAHPRILQVLQETNLEQTEGYGEDIYSLEAAEFIKARFGRNDVDIHFIPGGTLTNLIAISAFLRPHEAAISAVTGHINVHETGAIEATGHKVFTLPGREGKLSPSDLKEALDYHTDEHMVKPKLVYISNSTEIGSIYTKGELEALSSFCREHDLILFMDGARLGAALTSEANDLALSDLVELVDAFYIGGTKNGALIGEALVICSDNLKADFRYHIKQKGALLAKGRLMGIQFRELFRDDLFFSLAKHANGLAGKMQEGLRELGVSFLLRSPTNQIFPIFPNEIIAKLEEKYLFLVWEKVDADHAAIRLVTSWSTPADMVDRFLEDVRRITKEQG
ncbi:MAG: aminotransferase class V-fold PLP-dependent enzyme [Firmicutes bacterium]|jgi:threonine aldolase|nr:aminotransferase class I/II-fold pyridoxal phosphate-dependent enzyme [Bacillota bacterium]NLO66698.1 aminotransferase class V-fold PLP-dependent enzyme [Bacillota bacterium]